MTSGVLERGGDCGFVVVVVMRMVDGSGSLWIPVDPICGWEWMGEDGSGWEWMGVSVNGGGEAHTHDDSECEEVDDVGGALAGR